MKEFNIDFISTTSEKNSNLALLSFNLHSYDWSKKFIKFGVKTYNERAVDDEIFSYAFGSAQKFCRDEFGITTIKIPQVIKIKKQENKLLFKKNHQLIDPILITRKPKNENYVHNWC